MQPLTNCPLHRCQSAGLLSLLNEPEPDLQTYAIQELNKSVHEFWTEIADTISTM